jgi:hypothetical protein
VDLPVFPCLVNIRLLSAFGPARQKQDQLVAFLAEVDPLTRVVFYPALVDTASQTLALPEIAGGHTGQCRVHLQRSHIVQLIEPFAER